jgi:hypothetical protein
MELQDDRVALTTFHTWVCIEISHQPFLIFVADAPHSLSRPQPLRGSVSRVIPALDAVVAYPALRTQPVRSRRDSVERGGRQHRPICTTRGAPLGHRRRGHMPTMNPYGGRRRGPFVPAWSFERTAETQKPPSAHERSTRRPPHLPTTCARTGSNRQPSDP